MCCPSYDRTAHLEEGGWELVLPGPQGVAQKVLTLADQDLHCSTVGHFTAIPNGGETGVVGGHGSSVGPNGRCAEDLMGEAGMDFEGGNAGFGDQVAGIMCIF